MPPPTSIITTCDVPVSCAKNSVWPVNARPASLMTPLCTGAVTIASNVPFKQPINALFNVSKTYALFAGLSIPARAGVASA